MVIQWFGLNCFRIESDKSSVVIDPYDQSSGLRPPRLSANVVTISGTHSSAESVKGVGEQAPFVISTPGEYEVSGIFIYGIPTNGTDNIIYRLELEGISIAHAGNLSHVLENGHLERLEGVDILMIPVGGGDTINGKQATQIISQLEPRIVIPMHYAVPGLKTAQKLDSLDPFCKEIGVCPKEELNKFKIVKKDLPQEDLRVVLMQP